MGSFNVEAIKSLIRVEHAWGGDVSDKIAHKMDSSIILPSNSSISVYVMTLSTYSGITGKGCGILVGGLKVREGRGMRF